jgi:WD40 repeat protein
MVWDLAARKLLFKDHKAHPWCFSVALSPDGNLLACHLGGPPHVVQLWDVKAGKQIAEQQGFRGHVYVLAFSPDGKLLASGGEESVIRLWDVATHAEVANLKGHGGGINDLVFSPHGRWLYSASSDGMVRRWHAGPQPDPDVIHGDVDLYPFQIGFAPGLTTFFEVSHVKSGGRRLELKHWDLSSGRELVGFRSDKICLAHSPDGNLVVLGTPEHPDTRYWNDPLRDVKL